MGSADQNQQKANLLDVLQEEVQCSYLSNLRDPIWADALFGVVGGIATDEYPAQAWQNATDYITGLSCEASSAQEAKDSLQMFLIGRRIR